MKREASIYFFFKENIKTYLFLFFFKENITSQCRTRLIVEIKAVMRRMFGHAKFAELWRPACRHMGGREAGVGAGPCYLCSRGSRSRLPGWREAAASLLIPRRALRQPASRVSVLKKNLTAGFIQNLVQSKLCEVDALQVASVS